MEGPVSLETPTLHDFSLPTVVNTVSIASPKPRILHLPVASLSDVLSLPASGVPSAPSPVVLLRTSSWAGFYLPTSPAVAPMCPTSHEAASPSCELQQCFCELLAQREAKFAKLDDRYIQREEMSHPFRIAQRLCKHSLLLPIRTVKLCALPTKILRWIEMLIGNSYQLFRLELLNSKLTSNLFKTSFTFLLAWFETGTVIRHCSEF